MITEETVFILGAGASAPYGYPTAAQLRVDIYSHTVRRIIDLFQPSTSKEIRDQWESKAIKFEKTFEASGIDSIDKFLAINGENFSDIGKLAIIMSIFEYEQNSGILEKSLIREQDWYFSIYTKMIEKLISPVGYKKFGRNNVTFITFNYDRSLEYFLYNCLKNSFLSANEDEITQELKKIPILHVYGKIADLPWETNKAGTRYRNKIDDWSFCEIGLVALDRLKKNIYIIDERNNHDCSEIIKRISAAERIFFLGFGYASENIEILKLNPSLKIDQKIFGTAFKYSEKGIRDVRQSIAKNFIAWTPTTHNNPFIHDMDCVELLREYL